MELLSLGYLSLELPLLEFLSALAMSSDQARNLSLLDSDKETEFLDLEQKLLTSPVN